jgi:hypothetical protein
MAFLIHGVYHWAPRAVAFRNDFCRRCDRPRVSLRIRTFDVLHVFWVPVLPLGFWRRWQCAECGTAPHELLRTRRGFKIAGALCLLLFTVSVWVIPPGTDLDAAVVWGMRIGWPLLLLLTLRSIVRHRPEAALADLLMVVPPFDGRRCPVCGGDLLTAPELHCGACGARHESLRPSLG